MLDYLFKNATIVDGSGAAAYVGNVGVEDGKITFKVDGKEAKETVDCTGKHIFPGFIDIHSHGDIVIGEDYGRCCKISQGITTEVTGNCGISMFPVNPEYLAEAQQSLSVSRDEFPEDMVNWKDFKSFKKYLSTLKLNSNVKFLVGHGSLRLAVMGLANRRPTPEEMEQMKALLKEAMEEGALGLSSGLIYPPGCYSDYQEIAELLTVVKEYNGIYATHMRNESDTILDALKEAIRAAKEAGVPLNLSHFKVMGRQNWGLSKETIRLVEEARAEGLEVSMDQYPYEAGMTQLRMVIPPQYYELGAEKLAELLRTKEGREQMKKEITAEDSGYENFWKCCGGFSGIFTPSLPVTPQYAGKFVSEIAKERGQDEFECYFDLMAENETNGTGIYYTQCHEDMIRVIKDPYAVVGTDGICRGMKTTTHPRTWGTYPRAINFYVKELGIFTLEEMIRKMTSLTAEIARLKNKGLIAEGYDADLLVVDYDNFVDRATYVDSAELTDGLELALVNGIPSYKGKEMLDTNPGRLIIHEK